MNYWTVKHLEEATAGVWLTQPNELNITGISTDSRAIKPGNVFVALKGENFDGHDHLDQAITRGACAAIVSREIPSSIRLYKVDDTLAALQQLASHYRDALRNSGTKVIAVTGSNGKTTTRHLIHAVLSAQLSGSQSPNSFNNHIGVPLTLLAASPEDDFVVAEVGSNHPGEIKLLAKILCPDAAIITNIGTAHIGNFGSREAIADEKSNLLNTIEPDGLAVIPNDEPLLDQAIENIVDRVQIMCIGNDVQCTGQSSGMPAQLIVLAGGEHMDISLPLLGEHNITNALVAIAIGQWLGLDSNTITDALAKIQPVDMRAQIIKRGDITFINDAYNANPDSMRCAINMLANIETPGRRVAILGDMFELGDLGPDAHRAIGEQLVELGGRIDLVVLIGKLSMNAAHALSQEKVQTFVQYNDQLPRLVAAMLQPDDLVLIKASRGMALERLIPDL